MDFLELAKSRYSVRDFTSEPVRKEHLDLILQAGRVAPTACNRQPQRVLVLQSGELLEKARRSTASHFEAPTMLLVCYEKSECWTREFDCASSGEIDASIVATHMMLEAASIGVGTTWVMHFEPDVLRKDLNLPDSLVPVVLLPMGYPSADARPYPGHAKCRPAEETILLDPHF